MDYVIVTGVCAGGLEIKVLEKIKEGFVPCGGVSVSLAPPASAFPQTWAQAMIR